MAQEYVLCPITHKKSVLMTKKCLLLLLVVVVLFILYLNRDGLNPFKPDCKTIPVTPKPDACKVKVVAPGFEI